MTKRIDPAFLAISIFVRSLDYQARLVKPSGAYPRGAIRIWNRQPREYFGELWWEKPNDFTTTHGYISTSNAVSPLADYAEWVHRSRPNRLKFFKATHEVLGR